MSNSRILLAALAASIAIQATAEPPPVEAYGRFPAIGDAYWNDHTLDMFDLLAREL